MNTHLKQLWAAMKLPKNFKKSYKFFCRGLDIRVAQTMKNLIRKPFFINYFLHLVTNIAAIDRHSKSSRHYQVVIGILTAKFSCDYYIDDRMLLPENAKA